MYNPHRHPLCLPRLTHAPFILHPRRTQRQQFPKIRRPIPSHRIPPTNRLPLSARNNWTPIRGSIKPRQPITARRRPLSDIIQSKLSNRVYPWIQEAQRRKAGGDAGRVEERDGAVECRRRTACAAVALSTPWSITRKFWACAATSGNPRPEAL